MGREPQFRNVNVFSIINKIYIYNHHHNWLKTITFIHNFLCNNIQTFWLWKKKNFPPLFSLTHSLTDSPCNGLIQTFMLNSLLHLEFVPYLTVCWSLTYNLKTFLQGCHCNDNPILYFLNLKLNIQKIIKK